MRFAVDGIEAGDTTFGHRFLAPGAIRVKRFDDYAPALQRATVVLDPAMMRNGHMIVGNAWRRMRLAGRDATV